MQELKVLLHYEPLMTIEYLKNLLQFHPIGSKNNGVTTQNVFSEVCFILSIFRMLATPSQSLGDCRSHSTEIFVILFLFLILVSAVGNFLDTKYE
jgi:hypothetical protein